MSYQAMRSCEDHGLYTEHDTMRLTTVRVSFWVVGDGPVVCGCHRPAC